MSSPSTLRDIVVPAPEPGVVTCILKDAAELAFHLAEEGGGQQHDDAYAAAPAVVSTRGNTLRMVPAAPISSIVLRESSPSVHDGRASEPPSGPAAPASPEKRPTYTGPALLGAESTVPQTVEVQSSDSARGAIGIPAVTANGEIRPLDEVEADMIRLALGRYRGHMTEVAKRLNIGRSTLYRKMRDLGLEPKVGTGT